MQTARVIKRVNYGDSYEELCRALIPMPPPERLAKAFANSDMLYLYRRYFVYTWYKDGKVEKYCHKTDNLYTWFPKPTLEDASLDGPNTTTIKADGTVIRRYCPYPITRPTEIWEDVWPTNPGTVLVDGDDDMYDTELREYEFQRA